MKIFRKKNTFNQHEPLVTIAILSWNRFYYLKATIESAKKCIIYPRIEWIVSDNKSIEPGLKEYIESLDWIDVKIFRKQSHADAMNEIVRIAKGKYVLIWPEDIQFVRKGRWLVDIIEILENHPWVGSVGINYLRRSTNQSLFTFRRFISWKFIVKEFFYFRWNFRFQKVLKSERGLEIRTLGHLWPGICGSGIPTLTRVNVWKNLGNWRATEKRSFKNIIDSSLGAETDMVQRFYKHRKPLQQAVMISPVAADIITDPIGSKAKIRGNKRYGVYFRPKQGVYYYKIDMSEESFMRSYKVPECFEDHIEPIGFNLPFDNNGNLLKANNINLDVVEEIIKKISDDNNL